MRARILWGVFAVLSFLPVVVLTTPAQAQRQNTVYVNQFAGQTVGDKAAAAQQACNPSLPCYVVFGADLAGYPQGIMPTQCFTCSYFRYDTGQLDFKSIATGDINGEYDAAKCGTSVPPQWCAGTDIGGWINAAYAAGKVSSAVRIRVPAGVYYFNTPILFATPKKYAGVICDGGAVLVYTPTTGAAVTWDWGWTAGYEASLDHHSGGGMQGCNIYGPGSGSGGTGSGTSVGFAMGASNGGAYGLRFEQVHIGGFSVGIDSSAANASFGYTFEDSQIAGNALGAKFTSTGGLENVRFIGDMWWGNLMDIFMQLGNGGNVNLIANSFDGTTTGTNCTYTPAGGSPSAFTVATGAGSVQCPAISIQQGTLHDTDSWFENSGKGTWLPVANTGGLFRKVGGNIQDDRTSGSTPALVYVEGYNKTELHDVTFGTGGITVSELVNNSDGGNNHVTLFDDVNHTSIATFVSAGYTRYKVNSASETNTTYEPFTSTSSGQFASIRGTNATVTAGAGAGTSPTISCASSHTCTSISGVVSLTVGTSPAAGTVITIQNPTRATYPDCTVNLYLAASPYTPIPTRQTYTTTYTNITVGTALTASTAYEASYICGGI